MSKLSITNPTNFLQHLRKYFNISGFVFITIVWDFYDDNSKQILAIIIILVDSRNIFKYFILNNLIMLGWLYRKLRHSICSKARTALNMKYAVRLFNKIMNWCWQFYIGKPLQHKLLCHSCSIHNGYWILLNYSTSLA